MERRLLESGHDWWENEVCGAAVGVAECTRAPKHSGSCATVCQSCDEDWMAGLCECTPRCATPNCENWLVTNDEMMESYCVYCFAEAWGGTDWGKEVLPDLIRGRREAEGWDTDKYCATCLRDPATGQMHEDDCPDRPATKEELAEALKSLGVHPMQ